MRIRLPLLKITPKYRFLGLWVLCALMLASILIGIIAGESDKAGEVTQAESTKPISMFPNCQPDTKNALPNWDDVKDQYEEIWQSHSGEMQSPYFQGENGWIFWNDQIDQYASQAVGRVSLSDTQVAAWTKYIRSLATNLEKEGITFYLIITPSTSSIYPEELPRWMQEIRSKTSADKFMEAARDLPVIDLRSHLIDSKSLRNEHLYSWSNSHWTDYGAAIAWQQIVSCVNSEIPNAGILQNPPIENVQVIGDFNEWAGFGVVSNGEDWAKPTLGTEFVDQTVVSTADIQVQSGLSTIDLTKLPVQTFSTTSWTGKSALILRDSMGTALSPYWQQSYSPTWQKAFPWDSPLSEKEILRMAKEIKPQVVILQMAERHLITVPE